jgi:hypothetical protein
MKSFKSDGGHQYVNIADARVWEIGKTYVSFPHGAGGPGLRAHISIDRVPIEHQFEVPSDALGGDERASGLLLKLYSGSAAAQWTIVITHLLPFPTIDPECTDSTGDE